MVKKEFTSFDIAAAMQELRENVKDSRVNNIYQLDAKTLLFKLHKIFKSNYDVYVYFCPQCMVFYSNVEIDKLEESN